MGHHQGRVVFVPFSLPSEEITAQIIQEKKDYLHGTLQKILIPSIERREPFCPLFGTCGGCQLQHINETKQLQYKTEMFYETLRRIGKIKSFPIMPVIPSPHPTHYRSRVQLKVGNGYIGFYQSKSHQIVSVTDCPLLMPALNEALRMVSTFPFLGHLSEIEIQATDRGELLFVLIGRDVPLAPIEHFYNEIQPQFFLRGLLLRGIVLYDWSGRHYWGQDYLIHNILNKRFRVSDRSFFQVNQGILGQLIQSLIAAIATVSSASDHSILELYSGVGTLTRFLAERVKRVVSVEGNPISVEDARWNMTGISNVELITGAITKQILERMAWKGETLLINPPRGGVPSSVLQQMAKFPMKQILYLSCNPVTLTRDVALLLSMGYCLKQIQPFDFFPQTAHLESLTELTRP